MMADGNLICSDCKLTAGTAFSTNAIVKTKDVKVRKQSLNLSVTLCFVGEAYVRLC